DRVLSNSSSTPMVPSLDLALLSSDYVEQIYAIYQADPTQVSPEWQQVFRTLQAKSSTVQSPQPATRRPVRNDVPMAVSTPAALPGTSLVPSTEGKSNGEPAPAPAAPSGNGDAATLDEARMPRVLDRPEVSAGTEDHAGNGSAAGPLTVDGN